MSEWPDKNIWGAMPDGEDGYHLHRWLEPERDGEYEQIFCFHAEQNEVQDAAAYLNALEAEVERLKAYKALADEMAEAKRSFHTYFWWTDEMLPDWLTRYDALTKETTT